MHRVRSRSAPELPRRSDVQDVLLRRGSRIVAAMITIWVADLVLWVSGALGPIVWLFALAQLSLVVAFIRMTRSLRRSGPPFEDARWWDVRTRR